MIGFTVQGEIIDTEGASQYVTVILSLDTDAVEAKGKPGLDVRLASDDTLIGMFNIKDAYDAIYELNSQLGQWERDRASALAEKP